MCLCDDNIDQSLSTLDDTDRSLGWIPNLILLVF